MSEYYVGLDSMYAIEADSPEEAEAKLAKRLADGEVPVSPEDCTTYEKRPVKDDE